MSEPLRDMDREPEALEDEARSLRLLIVVDEAEASRAVRAALAQDEGGIEAEWVHDLDLGLERVRRHLYDVVVLDVALVGNRSLALYDEPALGDGDTWLLLVEEPAGPLSYPRGLLSRLAEESLPRDTHLADALASLLRLAHRSVTLRTRASRYRSLFRDSPDGILVFDAAGAVIDANPRALDQLGYRRDDLLGLRLEAFYPDGEAARMQAALFGLGAERPVRLEVTVRRRDGSTFPAEITASAFHGGGKELVQVVLRDLSDARALEERLRAAEQLLDALAAGAMRPPAPRAAPSLDGALEH
jgi:PAS domain S-box-containing protein